MGQIKWYKRDPERALNGMLGLNLEERGAYNTVLDLIYLRDGKLPDDDRFIAGYLGVDVRVWKRIKQRLIDLGKLSVIDGMIRDDVADVVVDEALRRVVAARNAGKVSADARAKKSGDVKSENRDLASTDVATGVSTGASTNKNKSKSNPPTPQGGRGRKLIPEDWEAPDPSDLSPQAKACAMQWPTGAYARRAEEFRNYWIADGGRKADWSRTWANRVLAIHEQVMRLSGSSTVAPFDPHAEKPTPFLDHYLQKRREAAR